MCTLGHVALAAHSAGLQRRARPVLSGMLGRPSEARSAHGFGYHPQLILALAGKLPQCRPVRIAGAVQHRVADLDPCGASQCRQVRIAGAVQRPGPEPFPGKSATLSGAFPEPLAISFRWPYAHGVLQLVETCYRGFVPGDVSRQRQLVDRAIPLDRLLGGSPMKEL